MSVISAKDFIKKATRVIEIDGFEHDEKIKIRIKSTSMMGMLITGKIPNSFEAGFQCVPKINLTMPISPMAGTPLRKINRHIAITAIIEIHAHNRNTIFIIISLAFIILRQTNL